jgi:hypothetical protein
MSAPRIKRKVSSFWQRIHIQAALERKNNSPVAEALTALLASHPEWQQHPPTLNEYMDLLMEQQMALLMNKIPGLPQHCLLCASAAVKHDVFVAFKAEKEPIMSTPYGLCTSCAALPDRQARVASRLGIGFSGGVATTATEGIQ